MKRFPVDAELACALAGLGSAALNYLRWQNVFPLSRAQTLIGRVAP